MISNENKKAYSEVTSFLKLLNESDKEKIPTDLREFFENNMDKSYIKEINPDIDIKDQNLMEETLAIIAMLNLKYWCDDEYKKRELITKYKENDKKYEIVVDNIRVADVVFSKKNEETNKKASNEVVEITPYKKENFFLRLIKKIFKLQS